MSALGACSSGISTTPVAVNGDVNFANSNLVTRISETVSVSKEDPNHFYIDAGNGQKTGASFSVNLNFAGSKFQTKASASGTPAKIASDVDTIDLVLTNGAKPTSLTTLNTTSILTARISRIGTVGVGVGSAPVNGLMSGTGFVGLNGTTPVVTFTNIIEGNYWVAATALTGSVNIAALNAPGAILGTPTAKSVGTGNGTTVGLGNYFVSGFGGTGGAGGVIVTKEVLGLKAQYVIQAGDTAPIGMNIPLLEATGATVESAIRIDDGNHNFNAVTYPVTVSP